MKTKPSFLFPVLAAVLLGAGTPARADDVENLLREMDSPARSHHPRPQLNATPGKLQIGRLQTSASFAAHLSDEDWRKQFSRKTAQRQ